MNDDELIEAMLVAMYDDGCPGAVDSMRAVLAIVREHDNRLSLARELGQAEAALKAMRAELQSLREHDGRDDAAIVAERERAADAENDRDTLRTELASVLGDWNALVAAIGSPTNGGAIGHAKALRAEHERLREALVDACERMERARGILRKPGESEWAMLDTAELRAALKGEG